MDPHIDPATDRQEFADRIGMYVTRVMKKESPYMSFAICSGDVVAQTKSRKRVQAHQSWAKECLDKWDAADADGRKRLVATLTYDREKIVKDYAPLL